MLEGKDLILSTKPYAKEDRLKSWLLLLSSLLILKLTYFGAIFIGHWSLQLLFSVLAGLMVVRVFVIYHDYLHKAILQDSILAKIIFTLFGMWILAPTSIWKRSHDYHHKHNCKLYTSSIGSFPLLTKDQFLKSSKKDKAIYLFIRHPLTISMGYFFAFLWGMTLQSIIKSSGKHWDSYFALLVHFGISLLVFYFFGAQAYFLGILLPALISSAMGSYLFYAQHNYPKAKYKQKEKWDYVHSAMESSSFMKLNPLMNWFTANIGYHHIHHVNARVPFYNLQRVYREIPEFQKTKDTSLSPADIYQCLRVKVWDSEQNKMISTEDF